MSYATTVDVGEQRPELPLPPGPPPVGRNPIALFRYLWAVSKDPIALQQRRFETYGDTYTSTVGGIPTIVTRKPDLIWRVLVEDASHYRKPTTGIGAEELRRLLGEGLLSANGEHWRRQRRLVQPAFTAQSLRRYASTMVSFTRQWAGAREPGEELDLSAEMMQLTLFIVARVLLGHDISQNAAEVTKLLSEFRQSVGGVGFFVPEWVPFSPRRHQRRALASVHRLIDGFIDGHISSRAQLGEEVDERKDDSLLAALCGQLGTEQGMSRTQLKEEALTLFFAGHETTSHALSWTFALLGLYPGVERRLRQEVREVLGERPATYDDFSALVYTQQVLQESMRLMPPAYSLVREAASEARLGSYRVPAGGHVLLCLFHAQRDPRHFADAERFDPQRFAPDAPAPPAGAYLPFGAGTRSCVGKRFAMLEATLILATIQQHLQLRSLRSALPSRAADITLAPRGGVPVRVEKTRGGQPSSAAPAGIASRTI